MSWPLRESDRPIVAKKRVMTVERRGLHEDVLMKEKGEPLGQKSHYGRAEARPGADPRGAHGKGFGESFPFTT